MNKPKSVDAYIAASPKEAQPLLKQMRTLIRKAAPKALEKISYGMPYYHYHGRLAYFAHAKNHIGLYALLDAYDAHPAEVKAYRASKATLQFPLDKKLPAILIKKLVKTQMKANERK